MDIVIQVKLDLTIQVFIEQVISWVMLRDVLMNIIFLDAQHVEQCQIIHHILLVNLMEEGLCFMLQMVAYMG